MNIEEVIIGNIKNYELNLNKLGILVPEVNNICKNINKDVSEKITTKVDLKETSGIFHLTNLRNPFYEIKFNNSNIILIDEPENTLHPSYQKKIPDLIKILAKKFPEVQFFISTHSNYLISAALEQNQELGEDLNRVYLLEDGQNVQPDGGPIDFSHFDNALSNLGVQPSDLLFANGVIWVEGPSDGIYVEKWLEMYAKSTNQKVYKPGLDFQFQMYGGALLKFYVDHEDQFDNSKEEITNMFKINPHSFVILDFDNGNSSFEQAKKNN